MITVLQGVGPFAVALHPGKAGALGLQAADTLPEGKGVRVVTQRESQKWLAKIIVMGDQVGRDKIGTQINSGGGVVVQGSVTVSGGSFVGRDQITNTSGASHPARRKRSS
jgi:hypothetical protein